MCSQAVLNTRMEGKRAAALCCLFIVLLSGQQQQVAAMSKFCECYKWCYPDCRNHLPRWMCVPKCMNNCGPLSENNCNSICHSLSLCGMAATGGTADVKVCVDDCNKHGAYASLAANLN